MSSYITVIYQQENIITQTVIIVTFLLTIIPENFGFAISVCRLRERGCRSKSVYVRVFNDLELLRYVLHSALE